MGKRGGPQPGAGRPSILPKVDRLLIGARADNELRALKESKSVERHHEKIDYELIGERRRILHEIPLIDRPLVLERAALERLPYLRDLWGTTAQAVRTLNSLIWKTLNGPQRFITHRTPQGKERLTLFADIAADESRNRGMTIDALLVESWRDEYRAWCKEQRRV
jgi:hypothetical protein